jgi:hypothetical protein
MERPARVTGQHRGLRTVHVLMRILLVCALVVLLTLIAMREVRGLAAATVSGRSPTSTSTTAPATTPSPGAAPAVRRGVGA